MITKDELIKKIEDFQQTLLAKINESRKESVEHYEKYTTIAAKFDGMKKGLEIGYGMLSKLRTILNCVEDLEIKKGDETK